MGVLRSLFSGATSEQRPRRAKGIMVDVEIVGESGYQDHLRQLSRRP